MENRVIKFRAWDECDKVMYTTLDFEDMMKLQIMQFTGLTDKNGKEIYEGDIVTGVWRGASIDKIIYGVVDFQDGIFGLENTLENGDPYSLNRLIAEVIGNIYENPELLKNEN